jgi:UDP-glucose 4-epimerase
VRRRTQPIPYKVDVRRPGDAAEVWATTVLAEKELSWK